MARSYRMKSRADAQEETRARILAATMALHDEKGVADTSFSDIAERAGVAVSTVLRHFPTLGELVSYCGMHAWQEMQPPMRQTAAAVFDGIESLDDRLDRLVDALDAFYGRASYRLLKAAQDRDRVPELAQFLAAVADGVSALVENALVGRDDHPQATGLLLAITQVEVWVALDRVAKGDELRRLKHRLLRGALDSLTRP